MNNTAENEYNTKNGLLRYYDPLARLLCVEMDFAPDIGLYYPDANTDPKIKTLNNGKDDGSK